MHDVLPHRADNVTITRAEVPAGRVILTPPICTMGEDAHVTQYDVFATLGNGRHLMMGDDPRLRKLPAQPRLADFFRHRFVPMVASHLLQSASLARKKGLDERVIVACLLHDIAMAGLITSDPWILGRPTDRALRRMRKSVGRFATIRRCAISLTNPSGTHIPKRISATLATTISRQTIFAKPTTVHVGTNGT
jgi:hypothetical protein